MYLSHTIINKFKRLLGAQYVQTDLACLLLNSYDCSPSSHRPDIVLTPTRPQQLPKLLQLLFQEKIPFIARASATNHAGSCAAVQGGAVINLTYLRRILQIDTAQGIAEVEPGVITGHLQNALQPYGFFYAPDPASEKVCTLGGNLAQNASGARCFKYGNTSDNTLEATFFLPNGQPLLLRHDQPGPDWLGVICGSEGTLGLISKMQVKILPQPAHIKTFLVAFASLTDSIETVTDLVAQGLIARCIEAMDKRTIQAIEKFTHAGYPEAEALLIIELDGTAQQIKQDTPLLETICKKHHCQSFDMARTPAERANYWHGRRVAYSALTALGPNIAVADGTVPRSALPQALEKVNQIITDYGVTASLLFHAGDGNFHPQLVYNAANSAQTRQVHMALQAILKTCVDYGGTISGEHGIGIEKRALMAYQYSKQTLRLFQHIKQAFDPYHLANPSKIIPINFEETATDWQESNSTVRTLQQEIINRFQRKQPTRLISTPATTATDLSTQQLNQIIEIDKNNFTVTVQAGVSVATLKNTLQQQHVYTALPPHYPGTIGQLIATKSSISFTKQIIGIQAILPNGDLVNYGGKFMKNAAGYNLCRLFSGSWGAFGLITQVTLRLYATAYPDIDYQERPFQPDHLFQALKQQIDPDHLFLSPQERA